VPKQLTDEHKQAHMEMCMQFLEQYHEGEAFLQWIVADETWVHHYEPASKCQCMEWKHTALSRIKKFKSVTSADKVLMLRLQ
jgi:hypothetical protein